LAGRQVTWLKVSDDLWRRPAILRLLDQGPDGLAAIALNNLAEAWVASELTDAVVPAGQPARLLAPNAAGPAVAALVDVGLWRPIDGGGWFLETYFEPSGVKGKPRNPTKIEVLEERARRVQLAEAGGRANAAKAAADGRRGPDGAFTNGAANRTVGPTDGSLAGSTDGRAVGGPSARLDTQPTVEPAPSPVTRPPVPGGLNKDVERDIQSRARLTVVEPSR
jgi:hypothetical protein